MAKKFIASVRLQLAPGSATPAPPVGSALGPYGINIMEFCKSFNEKTKKEPKDLIFTVVVDIYSDKSFTYRIKTPITSLLLKKAAGIEKGSPAPGKQVVGKVKRDDIRKIAEIKLPDLNTDDIEKAMRIIEGTAKNMGLEIVD